MKLFLSGAAGFLGSHLVDYLLAHTDAAIVCVDRTDAAGSWARLTHSDRLAMVHYDLRAPIMPRASETLLSGNGRFGGGPFDHVLHLAASSHVDRSVLDPRTFLEDNVVGTFNVLEWVRGGGVLRHGGKLLYFSTDEVFGAAEPGAAHGEWDRFCPTNPYAATKAAGECLTTAWAATYGLPVIVSHASNLFGERQDAEKAIPLFIEQIRRGDVVLIHADKTRTVPSSRFYLHAENACAAVLHLVEHGKCLDGTDRVGKYNITGDEEISNLALAERIADLLDCELRYELVDFVPNRPRHDMRYAMEDTALAALGWRPHVSLEEGLRRVVEASRAKRRGAA
jgi:dTDP-glucose 4,6-dehydratase